MKEIKMIGSEVPLISVCIPVFNGEKHIGESMSSVLRQTEENFELIVVDNCSTDRTLEIVSSFNDSRIKIFKNTFNIGSTGNFNRCIELSRGEYFVLLPHDDLLLATALKTFSGPLIADPQIGLVYSSYYAINGNGKQTNFIMVAPRNKIMSSEEALREFIRYGNPVQCAMVRKELFSSLGAFDANSIIMTDIDMWCRIALNGNKIAYFNNPQNCVRVHPEQGQRAFMKRDEHSLSIIADHLGYTPNQDFVMKNTYYLLVFKHLQTLFNRISISSDIQKLRAVSIDRWILGSLVKHLIFSVVSGKWADVRQDINLFGKIVRWAGASGMISVLLSMPFGPIKRLFGRFKKNNLGENF